MFDDSHPPPLRYLALSSRTGAVSSSPMLMRNSEGTAIILPFQTPSLTAFPFRIRTASLLAVSSLHHLLTKYNELATPMQSDLKASLSWDGGALETARPMDTIILIREESSGLSIRGRIVGL
jgi:hypothetical protein